MNDYVIKNRVNVYYDVTQNADRGTMWYVLDTIGKNKYVIVFTREDDGTVFGKVAYQPVNSIMQCDYDLDWEMPYDKATGEVDDTETDISSVKDIDWLYEQAERIIKEAIL